MTLVPAPDSIDPRARRFGRIYASDPRDLDYTMEAQLRTLTRAELKRQTQAWRRGPILDQGATSQCVRYALAAALGAAPYMHTKNPLALTEKEQDGFANLYLHAQAHDEFPGDESTGVYGTSGRAGMEYLRATRAISAYFWASDAEVAKDYISRVGTGPLVAGSDWFAGMDVVNDRGIVDVSGQVLGGHEYCVLWFDKKRKLWKCQQSWGLEWGDGGIFYIPDEQFQFLIWQANGDLASMVEVRK